MSITQPKKIIVGRNTYEISHIVYYYAVSIDIALPEVRDYQAMIFDLQPAYKDLNELEDAIFNNCVAVAKMVGANDQTKQDIEDTKVLFRYFQGYDAVKKHLGYRKAVKTTLDKAFAEIEKALVEAGNKKEGSEGAISKNVLAIFKKIKSKYELWTAAQFLRQRDNLYARIRMDEYSQF